MDETKQETPAQEMVTLTFEQHERDAVLTLLRNIQANRVVIPMLRQLGGAGPVVVHTALARETLRVITDVLNRGASGGILVGLEDAEKKMGAVCGPVPPLSPPGPAPSRRERRTAARKKAKA